MTLRLQVGSSAIMYLAIAALTTACEDLLVAQSFKTRASSSSLEVHRMASFVSAAVGTGTATGAAFGAARGTGSSSMI